MFTACTSSETPLDDPDPSPQIDISDEYINGEWEIGLPENHGVDPEVLDGFYESLWNQQVNAVLIVKDGYLISQYYKRGYDRNRVVPMYSCAKSFTSALVGIAVEQGLIESADTKITEYFPQLNDSGDERKKEITIGHLLSMTSGFNWPDEMTRDVNSMMRGDNIIEDLLDREMANTLWDMRGNIFLWPLNSIL